MNVKVVKDINGEEGNSCYASGGKEWVYIYILFPF